MMNPAQAFVSWLFGTVIITFIVWLCADSMPFKDAFFITGLPFGVWWILLYNAECRDYHRCKLIQENSNNGQTKNS